MERGEGLVGGLVGDHSVSRSTGQPATPSVHSYSAAWVEGSSMVGAVCGYTTDASKLQDLHYDRQLCYYKGVDEDEVSGVTALTTSELASVTFGEGRPWVNSEGMYPRLNVFSNTDASKVSTLVLAIGDAYLLPNTETDYPLPAHTPASGTFKWSLTGDSTARAITNNTLQASARRGLQRIKATVANITYRTVQLSFGISEQQPIIIDQNGLNRLRDFINGGQEKFYYGSNNTFYTTALNDSYVRIPKGGDGIHFKLIDDINQTGSNWPPMGTEDNPFLGYLDGDNHTVWVKNNSNSDNMGFFGYMKGRVKNLYMDSVNFTGDDYVGSIASYCHGTISHCGIRQANSLRGDTAVGGLVGMAFFSKIENCYNGSNINGGHSVGGIVGQAEASIIKQCFNYGIITGDSAVGGLVGTKTGEWSVENCYNSGIVKGNEHVGSIMGSFQTLAQSSNQAIINCYNAGYVDGIDTYARIYNDIQMCPVTGHDDSTMLTAQMLGDGLRSRLGDTYWSYHANEYPRLKSLDTLDASTVSVKSISLPNQMAVNNIVKDFVVDTTGGVRWQRHGNGTALSPIDPTTDSITLNTCGIDTLRATLTAHGHMWHRIVPLVVKAANISVDTVLSCGPYQWTEGDGNTYSEDGFYTWTVPNSQCSTTKAVDLYIAPTLSVTIAKHDACRNGYYNNEHNVGSLKASVSGGFSPEYNYSWSIALDEYQTPDSIASESFMQEHPDSLRYLKSGTYYLTVSDPKTPLCVAHDTIFIQGYSFTPFIFTTGNCIGGDDGYFEVELTQNPYTNIVAMPLSVLVTPADNYDDTLSFTRYYDFNGVNYQNQLTVFDTLWGVANGGYRLTITDSLGCFRQRDITMKDDDRSLLTIYAKGERKVYDGQPVSLNGVIVEEYDDWWSTPSLRAQQSTSGVAIRMLDHNDSVKVILKTPDVTLVDVDSVRNEIDTFMIYHEWCRPAMPLPQSAPRQQHRHHTRTRDGHHQHLQQGVRRHTVDRRRHYLRHCGR